MFNAKAVLETHPLASQTLRHLLSAVMPTAGQEEDAFDALASAYQKMGNTFPTEKVRSEVEDLYSKALSFFYAVDSLMAAALSLTSTMPRKPILANPATLEPETQAQMAWIKAIVWSVPDMRVIIWVAIAVAARLIEEVLAAAEGE